MSQFQVPKKKNKKKKKTANAEVKSSQASSQVLASEPAQIQPVKVITQVQPGKVATQVQPDKIATQVQPGKIATQVQPGKVATQAQPGKAASKVQPGKVASKVQPGKVASQVQQGKVTTQVQQKVQSVNNKTLDLDHTIKEVLPQKVGMTTKFKDVEVTMTSNENEIVNGTAKKKKKKKKSKQKLNEEGGEPSNEKEREKLLHFTENHIELVNHPEISVTISNTPPEVKEPPKPEENNSKELSNNKETPEKVDTPAVSKKKKKKKKKKNSITENSAPTLSTPTEPSEDANSPTYIKLPAVGDNCVLLVSHESFSNGSKQTTNNSSQDAQNKPATVLLKKKEDKGISNETPPNKTDAEKSNSVSVLPVYSDNSNNKKEKDSEFNVNKSLGKISDMIKKENDNSLRNGIASEEKEQNSTDHTEENTKTKAQLKAERRAKQEAQRAAKLSKNPEKDKTKDSNVNDQIKKVVTPKEQPMGKTNIVNESLVNKDNTKISMEREIYRKVQIFSHLPQYKDLLGPTVINPNFRIPPPILELGIHYSKGTICGSNARCVGFLAAVKEVIGDYRTSQKKTFLKDLESQLPNYLEFLGNCRPLSVSIVNAMRFLKHQINHIPENTAEDIAKESLCQSINDFVREEILLAKEAITISSSAKIVNNDTILVYAYSSLVKDVLCKAHDQNKSFRVIVVDSRAKLEGLQLLRQLVQHGLRCCYISINAISTVIKKVTKVVIGAHALLANGYVMSRLGCKILSLVSSANSVPVLVCCETYKFWERSLTDSIVHNELGNPEDLISINKKDTLLKWHELSSLHIYNLLYDVTPSDLISVVITEKGLIPCTSVPVLLRVKHAGRQE